MKSVCVCVCEIRTDLNAKPSGWIVSIKTGTSAFNLNVWSKWSYTTPYVRQDSHYIRRIWIIWLVLIMKSPIIIQESQMAYLVDLMTIWIGSRTLSQWLDDAMLKQNQFLHFFTVNVRLADLLATTLRLCQFFVTFLIRQFECIMIHLEFVEIIDHSFQIAGWFLIMVLRVPLHRLETHVTFVLVLQCKSLFMIVD